MITKTRPAGADPAVPAPPTPRRPRRLMTLVLVALLVIGIAGVRSWWDGRPQDIRDGTTAVDQDGLAARYGVNVTLIGVTAAGGLIDFRYQVVDPDKADPIIHDVALFPKLIVEDTGETLALARLPHNHSVELELGGHYFFLLANARNAIHPGSEVTVVIGDVRLEHVAVQG